VQVEQQGGYQAANSGEEAGRASTAGTGQQRAGLGWGGQGQPQGTRRIGWTSIPAQGGTPGG